MKDAKINNLQQINNLNFASCNNKLCRNMLGNKMNVYAAGSTLVILSVVTVFICVYIAYYQDNKFTMKPHFAPVIELNVKY